MSTLCEQVTPGDATLEQQDEQDGTLGTGSIPPEPLQGEADPSEKNREQDVGSEGDGT